MTSWFRSFGALAARVWRAPAAQRAYARRAAHWIVGCQRQRSFTLARARWAEALLRSMGHTSRSALIRCNASVRGAARACTVLSGSLELMERPRAIGAVLRGSGAVGGSASDATQTSTASPPGGTAPGAAPSAAAGEEPTEAARSSVPDTAPAAEAAPACPGSSLLWHQPSFAGAGGVQPPPLASFPRRGPSRAARPASAATAAGARGEPPAAEAAAHTVGDTRRTPDAIRQRRERDGDAIAFPATMPLGPWAIRQRQS
jgi:hypothetical protein